MSESKLRNRDEFIRWYEVENRTYRWIVEKYREKYNIDISYGTVSDWRSQLGLKKRQVRNPELIPWAVQREHRFAYHLNMLRAEARRRAGEKVADGTLKKLNSWKAMLAEEDAVVHYDAETDQGWWLVPRRHGIDKDLIRVPEVADRPRGSRE